MRDGDSWWFQNNFSTELFQLRLCWYRDGRSPWIPGCGQKWAHEGSPGWCSHITLLMWASPPHLALEGRELLSPASHPLWEVTLSSLLSHISRGSWLQYCYPWSETFITDSWFFCSLGRWTAQVPSSRGQQYNLCQRVCFCALWNTNFFTGSFSLFTLYYCSNTNKLFVLSSFPPCGSKHWLSCDGNFLMLQIEHKLLTTLWLLSLGYRTDAVAGDTPPLLLLLLLTDFSIITWAYAVVFLLG